MYLNGLFNLLQFLHHVLINMKTSGCIQNHDIIIVLLRMFQSCLSNIRRLVILTHGEHFYSLFLTVDLQLFDRCRAIYITCYQKRLLTFQLKLACKLSCGCCLTSSLKTCHHNYGNRLARLKLNLCSRRSHKLHKLFINDLDNHLSRVQSIHNILTDCSFLNIFNKILNYFKVNVRSEKCPFDLLHRFLYVCLCQASLTSKVLKYILKFFCQTVKSHTITPLRSHLISYVSRTLTPIYLPLVPDPESPVSYGSVLSL